jgi:hypothetical protein
LGHETIVRAFVALTTANARKLWGEKNADSGCGSH